MSLGANCYVPESLASLRFVGNKREPQGPRNPEANPELKVRPLGAPPVSIFEDRLPGTLIERLPHMHEPPSGTIRIILDLKDINYHRTFYLATPPLAKEPQPVPALVHESPATYVPMISGPAYAPVSTGPVVPALVSRPPTRETTTAKNRWAVPEHVPASVHLYAMSRLGPLSTTLPDNLKKPRLEDKKMIEFMMLQSSKSCSDLGLLHRLRKTIRKVRSYWNKGNPVYPFAFRKLRNRNGRAVGGRLERLGGGTLADDLTGFYIITEDFSNKVVNPEGIGRHSDESEEESGSELSKPSIPDD